MIFIDPSGQRRITIVTRPDGLFECVLDKFRIDDLPEYDHHREYWAPLHRWGHYDSVATAIREAAVEFPWVIASENP